MINELIEAKNDIKSALESKGVAVTGGLSTYADAIKKIPISVSDNYIIVEPNLKFNILKDIDEITFDLKKTSGYAGESLFREVTNRVGHCKLVNCENIGSFNAAFRYSEKIEKITIENAANLKYLDAAFLECHNLKEIVFNSLGDKLVSIKQMCDMGASGVDAQLTSFPEIDASNIKITKRAFYLCNNLVHIGGFKNLGMVEDIDLIYTSESGTFLAGVNHLSHDSIMNIINGLYNRASAGYRDARLTLLSATQDSLSDDEIAIATNKGWIIS